MMEPNLLPQLVPDLDYKYSPEFGPAEAENVRRLLCPVHKTRFFSRIPPNVDPGTYEIGRDESGAMFVREPSGSPFAKQWWHGADGDVACARCWNHQATDNVLYDLSMDGAPRREGH
jgi:hypothetical protein